MWKSFVIGILMIGLVFGYKHPAEAAEKNLNEIQLVKKAFEAQVQLSEKERNMKEIMNVLDPYFTSDLIQKFLKENLVRTDRGYQTFGTDFPMYYVPFFSYDGHTKVVKNGNSIYVIEKFINNGEGPVQYKDEFQGVRLIKVKEQWKIDEILTKVPNQIIKQTSKKVSTTTTKKAVKIIKVENETDVGRETDVITSAPLLNKFLMMGPIINFPFHMLVQNFYPLM